MAQSTPARSHVSETTSSNRAAGAVTMSSALRSRTNGFSSLTNRRTSALTRSRLSALREPPTVTTFASWRESARIQAPSQSNTGLPYRSTDPAFLKASVEAFIGAMNRSIP